MRSLSTDPDSRIARACRLLPVCLSLSLSSSSPARPRLPVVWWMTEFADAGTAWPASGSARTVLRTTCSKRERHQQGAAEKERSRTVPVDQKADRSLKNAGLPDMSMIVMPSSAKLT